MLRCNFFLIILNIVVDKARYFWYISSIKLMSLLVDCLIVNGLFILFNLNVYGGMYDVR